MYSIGRPGDPVDLGVRFALKFEMLPAGPGVPDSCRMIVMCGCDKSSRRRRKGDGGDFAGIGPQEREPVIFLAIPHLDFSAGLKTAVRPGHNALSVRGECDILDWHGVS